MVSALNPLSPEVIAELIKGKVPAEFNEGQGNETYWNQGQGPAEAEMMIWIAYKQLDRYRLDMAGAFVTGSKKDNKDCYKFSSNPKYPLTESLVANGWEQWQSTVTLRTREEAMAQGVKYKAGRYAVHFWVGPNGEIVLGKLKMDGKEIPHIDEVGELMPPNLHPEGNVYDHLWKDWDCQSIN